MILALFFVYFGCFKFFYLKVTHLEVLWKSKCQRCHVIILQFSWLPLTTVFMQYTTAHSFQWSANSGDFFPNTVLPHTLYSVLKITLWGIPLFQVKQVVFDFKVLVSKHHRVLCMIEGTDCSSAMPDRFTVIDVRSSSSKGSSWVMSCHQGMTLTFYTNYGHYRDNHGLLLWGRNLYTSLNLPEKKWDNLNTLTKYFEQ